jgi:NAD(P)-dependent dehydrogenase (short-subunit alcohol dehydrogenase family)
MMIPSQAGKLAVVTGANSGVGLETSRRLLWPGRAFAARPESHGGRRGLVTWPSPVGCATPLWR